MPNLIEVQKASYNWFIEKGLKEVFRDMADITDYTGNWVLSFIDYRLDDKPKYSVRECKERDANYAAPMRVTVRLQNKETGVIKESEVYMGDFPIMTDSGTFVINGAERVIVSQLVRSPGVYYKMEYDKTGKELFSSTVIPNRGAWLEYENDANDVFYVRIDKNRKIPITVFIRALGLGTDGELLDYFGNDQRIKATIEKDPCKTTEEALLEVYRDATGDNAPPKCIGGGTYAKMLPNMVAFGPLFAGDPVTEHQPDECIDLERLVQNAQIIANAIVKLANLPLE